MHTLHGALTAEQARRNHNATLATTVYACLQHYVLPVEVQDLFVHEVTCINEFDMNGERHGIWRSYHDNGNVRFECTYVHGKKHGPFKAYYDTGVPCEALTYHDDKRHGLSWIWYPDGILFSEGNFQHGKEHGQWRTWYNNGLLRTEHGYYDGHLHGQWCMWDQNGTLTARRILLLKNANHYYDVLLITRYTTRML